MRIAVIGAGLAGVSFSHFMSPSAEVTLFEKSRGVGGRLATRQVGEQWLDHGAQFFTCRTEVLQNLLNDEDFAAAVADWTPKVLTLEPQTKPFKRSWFEPHYVGVPTMTAFPKRIAQELDVRLSARVQEIQKEESLWHLQDDSGESLGHFDWVIAAMPAPQSLELIGDQFEQSELIAKADMSPCFSLMIQLKVKLQLSFDAAVVRNSPISWIALNDTKPERGSQTSMVVHSSNEWARANLEMESASVEAQLMEALCQFVQFEEEDIVASSLQRWRYAKVESEVGEDFLIDESAQLAAIGDWCRGNRAEDAFVSGAALAQHLQDLLLAH